MAPRRLVAFPLIIPWRQEFWSLPLYFPELVVGILWQWPSGLPYRGRPLPAAAIFDPRELRHFAPGELTQWQAYEKFLQGAEEVDDILRDLRGEPAKPAAREIPAREDDALKVAWRLEVMEAEQETHLSRVDQGHEALAAMLVPEGEEEEPLSLPPAPEDLEILDPGTARLRYLLWRREMAPHLGPSSVAVLLGRSSRAIFTSLRKEAGGKIGPAVTFTLPGCRSEEDFRRLRDSATWQETFSRLLQETLEAVEKGEQPEKAARSLRRWLAEDLPALWPFPASFSLPWEIWPPDPSLPEGGETLLVRAGLGEKIIPG